MAKIKPARAGKKDTVRSSAPGAISCLFLIITGLAIFGALTYLTFSRAQ